MPVEYILNETDVGRIPGFDILVLREVRQILFETFQVREGAFRNPRRFAGLRDLPAGGIDPRKRIQFAIFAPIQ